MALSPAGQFACYVFIEMMALDFRLPPFCHRLRLWLRLVARARRTLFLAVGAGLET